MKNRNGKGRGAKHGNSRFYRGRTTHTSSEQKKLKKQKEYRRAKLSKQKRGEALGKYLGYLRWLLVAALFILVINLLQIKSYEYNGLTALSDADKAVIDSLSDEYVSGTNSFKTFFNADEYEQYILSNASFVGRVEASVSPFSTVMKVKIVPKAPLYAYRGVEDSRAQWIASDGSLITLTDEQIDSIGASTPKGVIIDTSGVSYSEGDNVLPISTLDYMRDMGLEMELNDQDVEAFEVSQEPREMKIRLVGEKYYLLVHVDRSVKSTLDDYEKAMQLISKSSRKPTQYIDLRITDKVFYR